MNNDSIFTDSALNALLTAHYIREFLDRALVKEVLNNEDVISSASRYLLKIAWGNS